MKRLFREPLIHFLFIGAVIFVLFFTVNKDERKYALTKKIVVTAVEIERLQDRWEKMLNRRPVDSELKGLIDSYIREQVYYREALALGLDRDDTIIRRRLMQKMEFLSNDIADLSEPDEEKLKEYFLDNREAYTLPALVSFTHIYVSLDRRGRDAYGEAQRILKGLNDAPPDKTGEYGEGDALMLASEFTRESSVDIARLFGENFSDNLFKLDLNNWHGPVESGYGLHLVRLSEKTGSRLPALSEVKEKVLIDWNFDEREKTNEDIYQRLKENYEIIVHETPGQLGNTKQKVQKETHHGASS
ncbi:MAG: peptidylprolyl isomerase [Thermodesulfobacteriota bacterium]